jgi:hypothetical protein
MACSQPPAGYNRWTLSLYEAHSKKVVGIRLSDTGSLRTPLRSHLKDCLRIPTKQTADFVSCREEVREIYKRPYTEAYPVVCENEKPPQVLGDQ